MNAIAGAVREWSLDELMELQRAIMDELMIRALNDDRPLPRRTLLPDGATKRLRQCRFAGKPQLRVVSPDERPTRMQWNEARQSWD